VKRKILTIVLAVVAVGAISTILVSCGSRPQQQATTTPGASPESLATQAQPAPAQAPEPGKMVMAKPAPAEKGMSKAVPVVPAKPVANVAMMTIPAGTKVAVTLDNAVSSKDANIGDPVQATTTEPLVVDDVVLAPSGSAISGKVTDVVRASRTKSAETLARLNLEFTSLATVGGSESIHGTLAGGEKKASSTTGKDVGIIVGSGVGGAILGKVIGKSGKATAVGGVLGAAAGMGVAAAMKGNEVSLPAGTKLTIVLDNPVQVAVKK
jgi:hypothetical protein